LDFSTLDVLSHFPFEDSVFIQKLDLFRKGGPKCLVSQGERKGYKNKNLSELWEKINFTFFFKSEFFLLSFFLDKNKKKG
jgi:hypothetical protein